jgi:hypothetical protein
MAKQYEKGILLGGISDEDYAAAEGLRSTEVKIAATRSAAHWRASKDAPRKDTPALALGRLIHMAVLENTRFMDTVVVRPDFGNMRTAKVKAEAEQWQAELKTEAVAVTAEDMETISGVLASVRGHSRLPNLLATGKAEQSLFWDDKTHNLPLKCRPDWVSGRLLWTRRWTASAATSSSTVIHCLLPCIARACA